MEYVVKQVAVSEILAVRSAELFNGLTPESCIFEEDDEPDAKHLALYLGNEVIGCLSIFKASNEYFEDENQFRYRGMAIAKKFQGNRLGNLLLNKADRIVDESDSDFIWMEARFAAVNFYRRNGYNVVGNPFDIEGFGQHLLMYKRL